MHSFAVAAAVWAIIKRTLADSVLCCSCITVIDWVHFWKANSIEANSARNCTLLFFLETWNSEKRKTSNQYLKCQAVSKDHRRRKALLFKSCWFSNFGNCKHADLVYWFVEHQQRHQQTNTKRCTQISSFPSFTRRCSFRSDHPWQPPSMMPTIEVSVSLKSLENWSVNLSRFGV